MGDKMKKKVWTLGVVFICIFICICTIVVKISPFLGGIYTFTYKDTLKYLKEHTDRLNYVAMEVLSFEYDYIELNSMYKNDITYSTQNEYSEEQYNQVNIQDIITNNELKQSIDYLYDNGVSGIYKEGAVCKFCLKSSLDMSKGILYSKEPPDLKIPGITKINHIQDCWYYYEECMEVWLERN